MTAKYIPRYIIEPPEDLSAIRPATYIDMQSLGTQRYMPLYIHQLFQSTTWGRCRKHPWMAYHLMMLWGRLFVGSPPGTMPNDMDVLEAAADVGIANSRHRDMLIEILTHNFKLVQTERKNSQSVGGPSGFRSVSVELPSMVRHIRPIISMIDKSRTRQQKYEEKQRQKLNPDGKTTVSLQSDDGQPTVSRRLEGNRIEFYPPAPPKPEEIRAPENWRPDRTSAWPEWLIHKGDGSARQRSAFVIKAWAKAHLVAFSRPYEPILADWNLVHRWIAEDHHDAHDLADCLVFAAQSMADRGFAPRSMAPLQADVDAEFIEVLEGCNGKRRFGRARDGKPGPDVPDAERPPQYRRVQPVDFAVKKRKTDQEIIAEAMRHLGADAEDLAEG